MWQVRNIPSVPQSRCDLCCPRGRGCVNGSVWRGMIFPGRALRFASRICTVIIYVPLNSFLYSEEVSA